MKQSVSAILGTHSNDSDFKKHLCMKLVICKVQNIVNQLSRLSSFSLLSLVPEDPEINTELAAYFEEEASLQFRVLP